MEPQNGVPHEETREQILTVFAVVTIVLEVFSDVGYDREKLGGGMYYHAFPSLCRTAN